MSKEKRLIHHEKYKKISLTNFGERTGLKIVRKHRLWETFLFTKLDFNWIEIHEIAEQLEHIKSEKLVEKIDKLKEKENLKGILLKVNSPGGTFVSSKEIYDSLKFFNETKIKFFI